MIARKWTARHWIVSMLVWIPLILINCYFNSQTVLGGGFPTFGFINVSGRNDEVKLAVARAEAINMARASFIQSNGRREPRPMIWVTPFCSREEFIVSELANEPREFQTVRQRA